MEAAERITDDYVQSFACTECGAKLEASGVVRTSECPFCGCSQIIERVPSADRPRPQLIVPLSVSDENAKLLMKGWLGRVRLLRRSLRGAVSTSTRCVYLPAYLYSASAHCEFNASIGEDYITVETYTTRDSKGNVRTHTRPVTRTEWRDLHGVYEHYLRDILVTASSSLDNLELDNVEPYDLRALVKYDPVVISGWLAEEASIERDTSLSFAHEEGENLARRTVFNFLPGDSHQLISLGVSVRDENLNLVLLPLWIFNFRYNSKKPPVRAVLNGQTGRVFGVVPYSPVKIGMWVLLSIVGALVAVAFYQGWF